MDYLAKINHPKFREANKITHQAEKLLQEMGMSLEEARNWIRAWASTAGDGSN